MKRSQNRTLFLIIAFLLLLEMFFCCHAAEPESGKSQKSYLGLSAYIEDESMSEIMGETYYQQAICLLDLENGKIADVLEIPNGSLVVGDLSDSSIVHSISSPGYSSYHLGYIHDYTSSNHDILSFTFQDIQKWKGKQREIRIDDTARDYMILGIDSAGAFYALQPNSYLSTDKLPIFFMRDAEKTVKQYSTNFAYDPFTGWDWPSGSTVVSKNGKTLIYFQMSMDENSYWWLIDTQTDFALEYALSNQLQGPLCWMGDDKALAWITEYDSLDPVRILCVFDPYTGDSSKLNINGVNIEISDGYPEIAMAINDDETEIAVWLQPFTSTSQTNEYTLLRFHLETAEMTALTFTNVQSKAHDETGSIYQYTDGEKTIYIQNKKSCPSLFYVKQAVVP